MMVGHRGPYGKGYWGTIALQKLGAIKGSPNHSVSHATESYFIEYDNPKSV